MSPGQLSICNSKGKRRFYFFLANYLLITFSYITKGTLYLYVKTIERAHSPAHMWERIKLSNSYSKALEQVSLISHTFASHSVYSLDRRRACTLAKFHNSQMQATGYEDHPISHKNASSKDTPTVSTIFLHFCTC